MDNKYCNHCTGILEPLNPTVYTYRCTSCYSYWCYPPKPVDYITLKVKLNDLLEADARSTEQILIYGGSDY
jgi:hypothetical protein